MLLSVGFIIGFTLGLLTMYTLIKQLTPTTLPKIVKGKVQYNKTIPMTAQREDTLLEQVDSDL